jgi:acyl-CoA thioester hydrolase
MFVFPYTIDRELVDPTHHHVHHAKCLEILEKARIAYLDSLGCSYESMLARGDALVIVTVEAEYKRELKEGEVTVRCAEIIVDERRIFIEQSVYNARGKVVMEARIGLAFMSLESRRSIHPPKDFMDAVGVITPKD